MKRRDAEKRKMRYKEQGEINTHEARSTKSDWGWGVSVMVYMVVSGSRGQLSEEKKHEKEERKKMRVQDGNLAA